MPIVVVSAGANPDEKKEALAAGADAYLNKPVDRARLLATIGELLGLRWQCDAPPEASDPAEDAEVPSLDDLKALHRLAADGDPRGLLRKATDLADSDERLRPFAERLGELARNDQFQAVLALVERHLPF
jgi:DNA-binding response OmpR family regulator